MKNLLFTILLSLPTLLIAQDTLVAEIVILRTPNGIEISYSKDMTVSDKQIAEFLLTVFDLTYTKPKDEEKIKKL